MTDHAAVVRAALDAPHQLGPSCSCKSCAARAALAAMEEQIKMLREAAREAIYAIGEADYSALGANEAVRVLTAALGKGEG